MINIPTIQSSGLLDAEAKEYFDLITQLAKQLFQVPIAMVAVADTNKIWLRSSTGMPYGEIDHESTLGNHLLSSDDIFIIEDTYQDTLFSETSIVISEPYARFYASYPVKSQTGTTMGSLCIIDTKPRKFNNDNEQSLLNFGRLLERGFTEIEKKIFDPLTHLLNKKGFYEFSNNNLALSYRGNFESTFVYFYLDIDKSKKTKFADRILVDFSGLLSETLRSSDLIARLEDNIFVALLNNSNKDEAEEAISQLNYLVTAYNVNKGKKELIQYRYSLFCKTVNRQTNIEQLMSEVVDHAGFF